MKKHSVIAVLALLQTILCGAMDHDPLDAATILQQLSLRQKIGQLIVAAAVTNEEASKDFAATQPYNMKKEHLHELITRDEIGGVLFLGLTTACDLTDRIAEFQSLSKRRLLMVLDAEWPSMRLQDLNPALKLPHHMTLGAANDPRLTHDYAFMNGVLLRKLGVDMNLAPVADVNNNPGNVVINVRSFGADPARVAKHVVAYHEGLKMAGALSCAKHFPGHGNTKADSHYALPIINLTYEELQHVELVPFCAAIGAGIPAIMTAHVQIPALEKDSTIPATLSKTIITDLLRNELGFKGLIISDGLGMRGITDHHELGELEVKALEAGIDLLLCPVDVSAAITAILEAVKTKRLSQEMIDQKVLRVLKAKQWAFAQDKANITMEHLITRAHELKKAIFAKAITSAKDDHTTGDQEIISITGMHKVAAGQFGITNAQLETIKKLHAEGKNITVVLYGSPYALSLVEKYAQRVLIAYDDQPEAHEAIEAILKGDKTAEGKMPI